MRLSIDHRTHYRFSEPQSRVVQLLRLHPGDNDHQTLVAWRIDVGCDARLREARDGFGNRVAMLYADGPLDGLDISVAGEVITSASNGVLSGADEPLAPLVFRRTTERTEADAAIAQFAVEAAGEGAALDRLHRLSAALHARFDRVLGQSDAGASAAEAFACGTAAPRELAHLLVAAARSLAIPARYVSGYRSDGATACAPHAWAEAHVGALGWVGFDPWAGISPDERYVRVAVGLDANGAAPVAGSRLGWGSEALEVDLSVERLGGEE